MMKITKWSPDVCDCVIEYEWDKTLPVDQRIHTHKNTVNRCPEHSGLSGQILYDTILNECKIKEQTKKWLAHNTSLGELRKKNTEKTLISDTPLNWHFEGSNDTRKFHFNVDGFTLTVGQKTALTNTLTGIMGSNRIAIE